MKIFCIWKNFFSHGKRNLLFLPCNMDKSVSTINRAFSREVKNFLNPKLQCISTTDRCMSMPLSVQVYVKYYRRRWDCKYCTVSRIDFQNWNYGFLHILARESLWWNIFENSTRSTAQRVFDFEKSKEIRIAVFALRPSLNSAENLCIFKSLSEKDDLMNLIFFCMYVWYHKHITNLVHFHFGLLAPEDWQILRFEKARKMNHFWMRFSYLGTWKF